MNKLTVLVISVICLSISMFSFAKDTSNNEGNKVYVESTITADQDIQLSLTLEAQNKIQQFAKTLKQALVGAIEKQGFTYAVSVCKNEAPKIAQQLSQDGWTVSRTSLKPRNDLNTADDWERAQLLAFEREYAANKQPKDIHAKDLNAERFRYMQAIPTTQVCLACHGQNIEPSLLKQIELEYPNDKAVDFTLEDIRGAFTLSKALKN